MSRTTWAMNEEHGELKSVLGIQFHNVRHHRVW